MELREKKTSFQHGFVDVCQQMSQLKSKNATLAYTLSKKKKFSKTISPCQTINSLTNRVQTKGEEDLNDPNDKGQCPFENDYLILL